MKETPANLLYLRQDKSSSLVSVEVHYSIKERWNWERRLQSLKEMLAIQRQTLFLNRCSDTELHYWEAQWENLMNVNGILQMIFLLLSYHDLFYSLSAVTQKYSMKCQKLYKKKVNISAKRIRRRFFQKSLLFGFFPKFTSKFHPGTRILCFITHVIPIQNCLPTTVSVVGDIWFEVWFNGVCAPIHILFDGQRTMATSAQLL